MRLCRTSHLIIFSLLVSFLCGFLLALHLMNDTKLEIDGEAAPMDMRQWMKPRPVIPARVFPNAAPNEEMDPPEYNKNVVNSTEINYNLHIFYYAWYGNPKMNGAYLHWNHKRLAHWDAKKAELYSQEKHSPPDDIGANFYPMLGLYSSSDSSIMDRHMAMIRYTGVGVVVVSWYPPKLADPNGAPVDQLIPAILNSADRYNLKVALHVEDYEKRNETNLRQNIRYIRSHYINHRAYYWRASGQFNNKLLPVIYFYDSYRLSTQVWANVLLAPYKMSGSTPEEIYAIGLYYRKMEGNCEQLANGGFSGSYTYFSSKSTSYGSDGRNWPAIRAECQLNKVEFFPSVGPGYLDTAVRPWNDEDTQLRHKGEYFRKRFWQTVAAKPNGISFTSFNEWHEGTQIEPARPYTRGDKESDKRLPYHDYRPNSPYFYLQMTQLLSKLFTQHQKFHNVSIPNSA